MSNFLVSFFQTEFHSSRSDCRFSPRGAARVVRHSDARRNARLKTLRTSTLFLSRVVVCRRRRVRTSWRVRSVRRGRALEQRLDRGHLRDASLGFRRRRVGGLPRRRRVRAGADADSGVFLRARLRRLLGVARRLRRRLLRLLLLRLRALQLSLALLLRLLRQAILFPPRLFRRRRRRGGVAGQARALPLRLARRLLLRLRRRRARARRRRRRRRRRRARRSGSARAWPATPPRRRRRRKRRGGKRIAWRRRRRRSARLS